MKKIIASLIVAFSLAGCAGTPPITQLETYSDVAVPTVQPPQLNAVQWTVYNGSEIKKLAQTLTDADSTRIVVFALTPDGFKKLEANMVEINRFSKEQKTVAIFLKSVISARSKGQVDPPSADKVAKLFLRRNVTPASPKK